MTGPLPRTPAPGLRATVGRRRTYLQGRARSCSFLEHQVHRHVHCSSYSLSSHSAQSAQRGGRRADTRNLFEFS